MALSTSHISDEMAGRALRAFSQAAAMAPAMVEGEVGRRPGRGAPGSGPRSRRGERHPMMASRAEDASAASTVASSRAGGNARRGCGPCPRPAPGSGRASRAPRRCGSASRHRPLTAAPRSPGRRGRDRVATGARWPGGAHGPGRGCGRRKRSSASTQVSFEPPPWLELTTRLPRGMATLVRPPAATHTRSPSWTAKGRRSTWRGPKSRPVWVGELDSWITSCAIHPRGLAATLARSSTSSSSSAWGPMTRPLPPERPPA